MAKVFYSFLVCYVSCQSNFHIHQIQPPSVIYRLVVKAIEGVSIAKL
jgi:hypothetical protein